MFPLTSKFQSKVSVLALKISRRLDNTGHNYYSFQYIQYFIFTQQWIWLATFWKRAALIHFQSIWLIYLSDPKSNWLSTVLCWASWASRKWTFRMSSSTSGRCNFPFWSTVVFSHIAKFCSSCRLTIESTVYGLFKFIEMVNFMMIYSWVGLLRDTYF